MDILDYQTLARKTAIYPKIIVIKNPTDDQLKRCQAANIQVVDITWIYPLIGLIGEMGEVANELKKVMRDDSFIITDERKKNIIDEYGDSAWYFVILAWELFINLHYTLRNNINKLFKRKRKRIIKDKGRKK